MIDNFLLWEPFVTWLRLIVKKWTKPVSLSFMTGTLSDLTRSHADLVVENALIRQQLIVLNRQVKRPQLTNHDRYLFIFLAH